MTAVLRRIGVLAPGFIDELTSEVVSRGERSFPVNSPINGVTIADVPESDTADVEAAFGLARQAQPRWAAISVRERAAVLLTFHDLVMGHRDQGLDLVQWETGKARKDALEELLDVCAQARYYARDAPRLLKPRRVRSAFPVAVGVQVHHHPKGVVGIIAPWNYPLTLAVV